MKLKYKQFIPLIIVFYTVCQFIFISPQLFGKKLEYSLKEYLQQVTLNHPEQKLNTYDPKEAAASYHEVKYSYSPLLDIGYNHINNNVASMNMGPYKSDSFSIGLSKQFATTGTRLSTGFVNNHQVYDMGMPYDTWKSSYEFSITQPILRNGPWGMPGKKQLNILKEQVKLFRSIHNQKLEGIIFRAFTLYWQLQLNRKQLELTKASLKDSKDILKKNKRRVNLGTVDIVEVYDFEASYVRTKADFNNSKKEYEDLKKEFLYTLGMNNNIQTNNMEILLKDELTSEPVRLNRNMIYNRVKNNSKELKVARLQKKITKYTLDIAKVTMLPSLDFSLTSSFHGDDNNQSDLPLAIEDIGFKTEKLNLTMGLQFQIPLDFRALKVVTEKAQVNYNRSISEMDKIKHGIQKELDTLIRSVEYYWETEQAYKKTVLLMEKKLKQYKKKYFSGKVNSGSYVRANDDLRMWQKLHLATLFNYKLAKARLEMAQNIFLEKHNINELNVDGEVK